MSYVIEVDEGACAAHGDCVEVAPQVFELGDFAVVVGTASDDVLLAAAEACPSTAIRLLDSDTGDQVYP